MHPEYMIWSESVDGIDEAGLERLVHAFYARVREDQNAVSLARCSGQSVPAHMKHRSRITPALFDRWLALWGETARELMAPDAAAALEARAARIAESLQLALFFRLGNQPLTRPAVTTDLTARSVQ